jgi:CRP/FNR family cyclic AMP-dependent transcriptional regulator
VPAPPELLRKVGLFESLSERDIKRLADALKERVFSEGDAILTQGEGGVGFFVIGEGTVDYSVDGKRVGSGGPGDYFGEVALIDDEPRSATVTAATDVTVYGMTRWDFRAFVDENAEIASGLEQVMAKRQSTESAG